MRLVRLYAFIACLVTVALATSCHSAQKPTPVASAAQTTPPPLTTLTTADEAAPTSTATQPTATNTKPAKDAKPPKAKKKSPPAKPQQTAKPAVAKAQPAPEKPVLIAKAQAPTSPPAEIQSTQSAPSSHAVTQLLNQVEKEYQAGQDNYNAGHLEAAKQNFDRAFNLLLGSNLDIRSDARLQSEFDKILDGVNGLELMALQEGDGFAEQKSEPAPIDETNEVTFPVDPNVKAKAEAEIKSTHSDLPLMM